MSKDHASPLSGRQYLPIFALSPAPRAVISQSAVPGATLRSTPGFMLSPATAG